MVDRVKSTGNGHDKSGPPPRISPNPRKRMKFSPEMMAVISQRTPPVVPRRLYELPKPPPGVVPKGVKPQMAMDDIGLGGLGTWAGNNAFAWSAQNNYQSAYAEGLAFPGYAYLSELAQRPEYRRLSEIFATEMTRKWIELESVGNIDKTERIKELKDALDHYGVRDHFHECIALDGIFGRSHLFVGLDDDDELDFSKVDRDEIKKSIGNGRNDISKNKVSPDRPIRYLKAIEPIWTYPTNYESVNPLKRDWYEPNTWFVMGLEVHKSRLLKFVSRPVPDILKPSYAFGGLSMSQMAIPYINNWLNMRQNIANIVQAFSVFNLATDLSELITQDGDQLLQRAQFFNYFRNNQGLLLTNKDTEEFSNVSAPLGTLDQLLAQSQEFICSVSGIPLVKYTGLSPHGLNASSEGEIRSFYDWIHACQEKQIRPNLTTVIDFIMLSKWGEVDHEITYRFNPLWELDEAALATMRKTDADTGAVLVESGIISQEEERKRVAADPGSPYASIEVEDMPELRQEEEEGLEPHAGAAKLAEGAGEQEGEIYVPNRGTPGGMPGQEGEEGSEDGVEEDSEPRLPFEIGNLRPDYIEGENPIAEAAAMRDMIPDSPDRGSPKNRWLAEKAIERRKMGLKGNNPLKDAESLGGSNILKNSTRLQNSNRLKNSTRLQGYELDQRGRYLKDRRLQKESSADPFGGGGVGNDDEPLIGPSRRTGNDTAFDAGEWEESKHPRGQPENAGQFGPGGGGKEKSEQPKQERPEAKPLLEASITNGPLFTSQRLALEEGEKKLGRIIGELDPTKDQKTMDALNFILSIISFNKNLKLSEMRNYNTNYAFGGDDGKELVGAIMAERKSPGTAEIRYLGSLQSGAGIKLLKRAEQSARQDWKANKITLIGNEKNTSFYLRHGYKFIGKDDEGELHFEKDLDAAHDAAFDALAFDSIAVDFNWPEATKIAVSNALQTFAGHIAQAGDPHIYDTIDHIVMNFADYAHIAKSQAKSLLQDAIRSRLSKLHAHDAEFKESEHPREDDGRFTSGSGSSGALPHPDKMKKVGKQLGSNPGGKYEDAEGNKYYIKKGKTPEHAKNELLAGRLYNLAGVQTQKYKDVEGGGWIATEWQHFDKDNAKDFTPEEIKEAQKDFAVHAWLANWDAAGLDYDNQAIIGGKPASIDLGGALLYRAQGAPKGNAFGDKVGEWDTLRDSKMNYQNAKLFASMTPEQLKQSAKKVISIPDAKIREAVKNGGMPDELATKLIARKNDIAKRAGTATAAKPEIDPATPKNISGKDNTISFHKDMKDAPKSLHGVKFESWHPPDDWEDVEGQMDLDEDPIDADEDTRVSSGLIMQEPDGRVWLVKPSYQYGGYKQTWPKGGQEEGLSLQANAIKETFEEIGLKGRITGLAGDFEGDTGITRFYHARREGGTPLDHDKETELVILASHDKLTSLLNRSRDRKIAETLKSKGAHDKATNFKESEHPRENDGKFKEGASEKNHEASTGVSRTYLSTKFVDGKRVQANGEALPEHIQKLKIPPAWTDVTYSSDPSAALLVSGKDSKGRNQSIYSDEHHMKAGAEKFARIKELDEKFDSMMKENDEAIKSADLKRKDVAECLALIASLGIRPGSEADTGVASRAYGATTLQGRHVVRTEAGNVYLRFIGKKGVKLSLKVTDQKIVEMLERRSKEAGEKGKLFPRVSDKSLLDYVHSLDGGNFKTKDFRTYIGTKTAMGLVEAVKKQPTDMKSYKKAIREVAKKVSDVLGNTPAVALTSYINPTVFAQWQEKIAA